MSDNDGAGGGNEQGAHEATALAWQEWIGRREERSAVVHGEVLDAMSAIFSNVWPSCLSRQYLPPGGHWLLFNEFVPADKVGLDGHPKRGGFLPPINLHRRMWAGSRVDFHRPMPIGVEVSRTSRILSIQTKRGRDSSLVFVTVEHRMALGSHLLVTEEQDLVYLDRPKSSLEPPGAANCGSEASTSVASCSLGRKEWIVRPDEVSLFQYSAATRNSHRIHYDVTYARQVERYPSLVVQGPLTATMLLLLATDSAEGNAIKSFAFQGKHPLYAGYEVRLVADRLGTNPGRLRLTALNPDGRSAMSAVARY